MGASNGPAVMEPDVPSQRPPEPQRFAKREPNPVAQTPRLLHGFEAFLRLKTLSHRELWNLQSPTENRAQFGCLLRPRRRVPGGAGCSGVSRSPLGPPYNKGGNGTGADGIAGVDLA